MGTFMAREEGCSWDKVLHLLLLHVWHISFITTGKVLRAPATYKKFRHLSDFVDLDSEIFVFWVSNCKKRKTTHLAHWKQENVDG